jgi:hypothetical protein
LHTQSFRRLLEKERKEKTYAEGKSNNSLREFTVPPFLEYKLLYCTRMYF